MESAIKTLVDNFGKNPSMTLSAVIIAFSVIGSSYKVSTKADSALDTLNEIATSVSFIKDNMWSKEHIKQEVILLQKDNKIVRDLTTHDLLDIDMKAQHILKEKRKTYQTEKPDN